MHWIYLLLAILFEVAGTISMKLSAGFTKWQPSLLLVVCYICSLIFLTLTLKTIQVSVAYAIWSGMGIVMITLIGFLFFAENINLSKAISIILILIGVITLNLTAERPHHDSSVSQANK
ncbi:multidrug efflux SMR transporter [Paenibacillus zeisoli]|uniref:Multidrug efflux SMR transporter n=1 Tax=Paenibacillus zeisoli TaxID=2496267 RepID=A0A3S1DA97_9BACL|nr:multidrug efflux SMR transporter [Paenibacillus zeisoli]RUT31983.1 multidrug efflux SMR transporter [Paenibacillus zeisoli]